MKKLLVAIILGAMCGLCACGSSDEEANMSDVEMESGGYVEDAVFEQEVEIVELTMDNWQDYYEYHMNIREERDEFGDLDMIWYQYRLVPKEEYEGRIVVCDGVAFKYTLNPTYDEKHSYDLMYRYKYNIKTGEYTRTYIGVGTEKEEISYINEYIFEPYEDVFINLGGEYGMRVGDGKNHKLDDTYWEFDMNESDYLLLNVKGKLHIIKE